MKEVKENVKWEDVEKIVVVNKCDLETKISQELKAKFQEENNIEIIEVSAKTGSGVTEAFVKISEKLIAKR